MAGITASSVVTYYIGRRMRRDTVRRLAGEKLDRMAEENALAEDERPVE